MTRKHFVALADANRRVWNGDWTEEQRDALREMIAAQCEAIQEMRPKFNADLFLHNSMKKGNR